MADKITTLEQFFAAAERIDPEGWAKSQAAHAELQALCKDALLGRFVRLHMTECHGGWAIAQTFIPGAPSLEEVTDALDPALIERALAR